MKRIIPLALAIFLTGCTTVGVENIEKLQPGTKIAMLSLLGNALVIQHTGTTVFQSKYRDLDITDWQIDNFTESTTGRLIRNGKKFTVVETKTEETRTRAGKVSNNFWTGKVVLQGGLGSVTKLARDTGADYILVLGPTQYEDVFFHTNQNISGYGIYQRSFLGLKQGVNYLTMQVALFDGHSGAEIASTYGYLGAPRTDVNWLDNDNLTLSMSNAKETRSAIEALIETLLQKELIELKLIQ